MPETSGTWTGANVLALGVYRGAVIPTPSDGVVINALGSSALANYFAVTPTTYPSALGTHWWLGFGTSDNATNLSTAPAGMSNIASSTHAGVHDTGGPVATNWPSTNVTLNVSGIWTTGIAQIAAAPSQTVSRVGCAVAEATTVPVPAGHQIGDLMVMHVVTYSPGLPGLPSGWTQMSGLSSSTGLTFAIYYKTVAISDFTPVISVY